MITYLIEVSICWLLFYGIYILLLSKETFFNINRWYLLSTLVLGLLIPLFTVEFSSFFYRRFDNANPSTAPTVIPIENKQKTINAADTGNTSRS